MTGPCTSTVHPLPRRPWLLLPFLLAVLFLPSACSDQLTEPGSTGPGVAATVSHPLPKSANSRMTGAAALQARVSKPLMSFGTAFSATGKSVLILADTDVVATTALATSLGDAALQVTVRPGPEYTWDGTDPALSGFDVVIHLNGSSYESPLPASAQDALTSFVQNGGGFIGAQWNGQESQPQLTDLILQAYGGDPAGPEKNCAECLVTYETLPAGVGHPVLAGLPSSFTFMADANDAGPKSDFSAAGADTAIALMQVTSGGPAVLVRQFGAGRVVNFSFAPNYDLNDQFEAHDAVTLQDPTIQQLYYNAVLWASGSGSGTAQPQTITFAAITDKVYGDVFAIDASASSGLPVGFTAAGQCSVLGNTVSITAIGSCTITAHQAGNNEWLAAADVSRSFTINKAPATITIGTEFTFDGTVKAATVTTNPAGLAGVTVTYSQDGSPVAQPINAGDYQVLATLDNPNYVAPPTSGTLTIHPATSVISWTPASITAGAPLAAAQLNATARGVGGIALSGNFVYTPPAGTTFAAGTATLSVQFTPSSSNYTGANKSVTIRVLGGLTFSGFFAPVRNMPVVNVATAGSAIPMKFTIGGYAGPQIFGTYSPSSERVQCGSAPESKVRSGALSPSGLRSLGYGYTYVWKTDPTWAGTCRKFVLTLSDGSTHEALFRFPAKMSQGSAIRRILGGR
jgi:MBG domain-containing protein